MLPHLLSYTVAKTVHASSGEARQLPLERTLPSHPDTKPHSTFLHPIFYFSIIATSGYDINKRIHTLTVTSSSPLSLSCSSSNRLLHRTFKHRLSHASYLTLAHKSLPAHNSTLFINLLQYSFMQSSDPALYVLQTLRPCLNS